MGINWRPHNKLPFPSNGPYGGEWNRKSLRKCIHCRKATTLEPPLHPWCEEAHRREVKRLQELQKKKVAQRKRSGKLTKAEWKRLKNLTSDEWQQEKRKLEEQSKQSKRNESSSGLEE